MGFTSIPQALINVGKALVQPLFQYFKDNDDYLYGKIESMAASGVMNGSFELDTDLDNVPNNWTVNTYPGGQCSRMPSIVLSTDGQAYTCIADHTAADTNKPVTGAQWATYWQQSGSTTEATAWSTGKAFRAQNAAHGRFGLYFVHAGGPGNGGGYADSDYVPCSPLVTEVLGFIHWATNAAMRNQVYVLYYDKDKVYLSETQLYSSTSNPTSKTAFQYQHTPPANAQFFKVRLIGGYTDTNQAGTAYFDRIYIDALETKIDLKFSTGSWSVYIPSGYVNRASLQEYAHWPQMRASNAGSIVVYAGDNTYYATLGTSNSFEITAWAVSNATWYGSYLYHSASEQAIYVIQEKATGDIVEIHIAERANKKIASNYDANQFERREITKEMTPYLFDGKMARYLAGDIFDDPILRDKLKAAV